MIIDIDIIEGLKCCNKWIMRLVCNSDCPFYAGCDSYDCIAIKSAIDIINRKNAIIENLTDDALYWIRQAQMARNEVDTLHKKLKGGVTEYGVLDDNGVEIYTEMVGDKE